MSDEGNKLDQIWKKAELSSKKLAKNLINGLSSNDENEITSVCEVLQNNVKPALELDSGESKQSSLHTIDRLITERRPPKDQSEINDLENAIFFNIVKEVQSKYSINENQKYFLDFHNTSLEKLKTQYSGRKFGEIVLYHTKRKKVQKIVASLSGINDLLHPVMRSYEIEKMIDELNTNIYLTSFWARDCGKAFDDIINIARSKYQKHNLEYTDDDLFNVFNVIVLNFAYGAKLQPEMKKFIKKSVKKKRFFN